MIKKRTIGKRPTAAKRPAIGNPMSVDLLQEIVKLMAANDLNTVDVRDGDKRVIIRRGAAVAPMHMQMHPQMQMQMPMHQQNAAPAPAAAAAKPAEDANYIAIKSPMVGTFYASPNPDAKAFVSVGTPVNEDSDVCIIEAMKVFNNIKAECRGTVAKVLISSGQTVEFGQTMFLVKP